LYSLEIMMGPCIFGFPMVES